MIKVFFMRVLTFVILKYENNRQYFICAILDVNSMVKNKIYILERKLLSIIIIISFIILLNIRCINSIKILYLYK